MIAQEIVNVLSANIPMLTDGFSETTDITSIIPSGTTATATTTTTHSIIDGQLVAIMGALAPVQIDAPSFLRTGSQAIFKTLQNHDLTLSERDKAAGGKSITISGAIELELNGTFQLIRVVNRRELIIALDDSGSTTISGTPLVDDANGSVFNGWVEASNITSNTFDYELSTAYPLPATGSPKVTDETRITSVLDIQQYLNDVYTKQDLGDDQLIVQLGDVTQSKKRNEETDADDSTTGEYSYTPTLLQSYAIYIIQNVTDQIAASRARDKVESEYIPAIFKSVLREKFKSGFTYNQFRSTFTGHGVFGYADTTGKNKAIYIHEVTFQMLATLDKLADTVGPVPNVAMRDIEFIMTTDKGSGELLASVDLDEEPIE